MSPQTSARDTPAVETVNSVHIVGRVSWGPEVRVLPSGDEVVQLRVVVPRAGRRGANKTAPGKDNQGKGAPDKGTQSKVNQGKRAQVDAIEVACWSARTRAAAMRLSIDDYADLEGSLHRRFYAGGQGRVSRYEVEAQRLRRVRS
ncbi:single-stranded DNA-binding protein [Ornithinimicrobium faecis]|uniref:Single-stranded DNA-binding protein n=1 Tax=Ornithinimicrobium faecis TaxID=2934158 RepID=A0ABY4YNL1_9MICO|nr:MULTISPECIES: single-stranded DNA-binding protein [unclassified Ornithinimicrobium]USQ78141.1 single-stranded DNA-binding protein [Ornithinimicrobium sp. HY1793]